MEWPPRSQTPKLRPDAVHVWRVPPSQTEGRLAAWKATLDEDERQRAAKFYFDPDRERYIAAHGALRQLMAGYLETAPAEIQYDVEEHGKPVLARPLSGSGLEFNLSHAGAWALVAVAAGGRVGVDLEAMRPERYGPDLARAVFTPEEIAWLTALPLKDQPVAFFQGWTRMEAYVKASGIGVIRGLRSADDRRLPEGPALLEPGDRRLDMKGWGVETLHPAPGYIGAVAAEGLDWELKCWTLEPG